MCDHRSCMWAACRRRHERPIHMHPPVLLLRSSSCLLWSGIDGLSFTIQCSQHPLVPRSDSATDRRRLHGTQYLPISLLLVVPILNAKGLLHECKRPCTAVPESAAGSAQGPCQIDRVLKSVCLDRAPSRCMKFLVHQAVISCTVGAAHCAAIVKVPCTGSGCGFVHLSAICLNSFSLTGLWMHHRFAKGKYKS